MPEAATVAGHETITDPRLCSQVHHPKLLSKSRCFYGSQHSIKGAAAGSLNPTLTVTLVATRTELSKLRSIEVYATHGTPCDASHHGAACGYRLPESVLTSDKQLSDGAQGSLMASVGFGTKQAPSPAPQNRVSRARL